MVGKATAEVQRFTREQEAEGIRMVGEAEAEAIRAKGIAEAEAMEKKALAYQKYNDAAMAEMLIQVLPEIAGKLPSLLNRCRRQRNPSEKTVSCQSVWNTTGGLRSLAFLQ